ncbi:MAG: WG repeat-containing protein [Defluviitaleaceae bacterium]|nr:WG repeat-containing protein [Defluviitaleaceae bacterium]
MKMNKKFPIIVSALSGVVILISGIAHGGFIERYVTTQPEPVYVYVEVETVVEVEVTPPPPPPEPPPIFTFTPHTLLDLPEATNPLYTWAVPPVFEHVDIMQNGMARVTQNGLVGLVDVDAGLMVVPPTFRWGLWNTSSNGDFMTASVLVDGSELWGVIDRWGREVLPFVHSTHLQFMESYNRVISDPWTDNAQIIDIFTGEAIFNLGNRGLGLYLGDGVFVLATIDNNIASTGLNIITGEEFEIFGGQLSGVWTMHHDSDSLMAREMGEGGKAGIINRQGEVVLPFEFDWLDIRGDFVIFAQDGLEGLMDMEGNVVLPLQSGNIHTILDGRATVYNEDGRVGLLDITTGQWVLPATYLSLHMAGEGRALAAVGDSWDNSGRVLIDTETGREIIRWDNVSVSAFWFDNGIAAVILWEEYAENNWREARFLIDREGRRVSPDVDFEHLWHFNEGLFGASLGQGQAGMLNSAGQWVLPPVHDVVNPAWHHNLIPILVGSEWTNHAPADASWTEYHPSGGYWGVTNRNGEIIIPTELDFQSLSPVHDNDDGLFYVTTRDGGSGVIRINPL